MMTLKLLTFFASVMSGLPDQAYSSQRLHSISRQSKMSRDFLSNFKQSPIQDLFQDYWTWRLKNQPQLATYVGNHDYDDQLNDMSLESYETRYGDVQQFLERLKKLENRALTDSEDFYLNSLKYELETYIEGHGFNAYLMPINSMQGIHENLESVFDAMPTETFGNFKDILSRLRKVPTQIHQVISLLRHGVKRGITSHEVSVEDLPEAINRHLVDDPEDSVFYKSFLVEFNPAFDKAIEEIKEDAKEAIEDIIEAYRDLKDYLKNEYITRPDISVASLPNGDQFYKQCIKFQTSTDLTPNEIHNIGLEEVRRISNDMKNISKELGYDMSVEEFSSYVAEDSRNYFSHSGDLIAECDNIIFNRIGSKLSSMFHSLPKSPIEVRANPLSTAGSAYHENPSLDGERPGYFVIGIHDPKTWPKYSLLSLSLHEANPGHHLQASHVIESHREPKFRKLTGAGVSYGSCPSQFPSYAYYLEGWALYAEKLGFDMGLYSDPLEKFGHYSQELFRACRLVVDTGIHALGWSREMAIQYMLNHIAFTRSFVEKQIDRYITWPGQALSYKIGQIKILEFRKKAENTLGNKFNLKDFHKVILDSYGSLESLEKQVNKWIELY